MQASDYRRELTTFIQREFVKGTGRVDISPDDPLLSSSGGILDSLNLQRLLLFVEEQFAITVPDEDLLPETFETINDLAAYLETQSASTSAPASEPVANSQNGSRPTTN